MAYPAVAREGCVYHQGGLVALVHRFSSFLFYGSLSRSLGSSPATEGMLLHLTIRGPAHRVIAKNPIAIGGCLSLHWQVWSDEGAEPWVVEVLRWGIPDSLPLGSHLIQGSHPFTGICLQFHQGQSSGERGSGSAEQGCLRAGSASISRLVQPVIHGYEASGAWRPVIDLSTLNLRIQQTSFKMETLLSVLLSVRPGDWMVSLGLKDAYLQVPMHPDSRKFLRFMVGGNVYQFKVLCFGLSMAPQVFTRVMAPVSAILHRMGVRLRRYLDDWLLQASSREQVLLDLWTVLQLCRRLEIVVNWEKSQVLPTQQMVYLGVILDSLLSGLLLP